jgi:hypothetical protein
MAKLTEKEEAAAMIRLEMGEPLTSGKSWQEEFGVPNEDVSRLMKIAHRRVLDRKPPPNTWAYERWRLRKDPEYRAASYARTVNFFRYWDARMTPEQREEMRASNEALFKADKDAAARLSRPTEEG